MKESEMRFEEKNIGCELVVAISWQISEAKQQAGSLVSPNEEWMKGLSEEQVRN